MVGMMGSALVGILVGGIVLLLVRLGLFLVGASLGVLISSGVMVLAHHEPSDPTSYALIGVSAVVFGTLAMVFQRGMVVLTTSACGAYAITTAFYYIINFVRLHISFLDNNTFSHVFFNLIEDRKIPTSFMGPMWLDYLMLGVMMVLMVVGITVQHRLTGKTYTHHREPSRAHLAAIRDDEIEAAPLLVNN